jgi:hypothetical protein
MRSTANSRSRVGTWPLNMTVPISIAQRKMAGCLIMVRKYSGISATAEALIAARKRVIISNASPLNSLSFNGAMRGGLP